MLIPLIILFAAVLLYTCVRVTGDMVLVLHKLHWAGPSPATRWVHNLKHHLGNGGMVYVKTNAGITARVAGDVGVPQPRTAGLGAVSTVHPTPLSGAGVPPTSLDREIGAHAPIFITRTGDVRPTLPTVSQYAMIPLGTDPGVDPVRGDPSASDDVATPAGSVVTWNLWPPNWPNALMTTYDWFFNLPMRVVISTGHFALQGTLLKLAWSYPLFPMPIRRGCISLGMVYLDTTPSDIIWGMVSIVASPALLLVAW